MQAINRTKKWRQAQSESDTSPAQDGADPASATQRSPLAVIDFVVMLDDGNCMFYAMAHQLLSVPRDDPRLQALSAKIRQLVAQFLRRRRHKDDWREVILSIIWDCPQAYG